MEGIRGKKLSLSFAFEQFINNWRDWRWYYFQFTNHIVSKYYSLKHNNGIYVWKEDWDYLIILDSCRYDVFSEKFKNSRIEGILEKRISRGSSTLEFLEENFEGRRFPNIIYVTANPFVYTILNRDTFYKTIHLWIEDWDEKKGTVPPDRVTKKAIELYESYPNKRLIVHFMQPHEPFIGSYKKKGNFWQVALSEGREEVMKAYKSNLDFVFPYVVKLLNKFEGKTVVTSDHGQACGELATPIKIPIYGHPTGVHIPVLVEVPWLIVTHKKSSRSERRRIRNVIKNLKLGK